MVAALVDGVHGRAEEESDGFVDMALGGNGGERELGERFGDTYNRFELTDCDWDGGAGVGLDFRGMDLSTNGDEVGGELLGSFSAESRCAASEKN